MNHQFRLQALYTSIRQILATFREYAMINTMNDVNQANHADHTNPMTQIDHLFDEKVLLRLNAILTVIYQR